MHQSPAAPFPTHAPVGVAPFVPGMHHACWHHHDDLEAEDVWVCCWCSTLTFVPSDAIPNAIVHGPHEHGGSNFGG